MAIPITYSGRIRSIKHAISGIILMLKTQHNAWIHLTVTLATISTAIILGISQNEWCLIVIVIIIVWSAEAMNTAFEFLCDVASPEFHPLVKNAKDVAAGSVLISAIGSVIIGIFVFGKYL